MLKKFFVAAAPLALAFGTPVLATDKPDMEEMHEHGEDAAYNGGMSAMNPFAGFEDFALKKPIIDLPKPDPARLAVAEKIVAALYPDGTSARIFTNIRTELFQPVINRFWTMKESEFIELFGMDQPQGDTDEAGNPIPRKDETLAEAMSKDDPHAKERIEAFLKTYLDLLGEMSAPIEGDLRGAMARDYARRYDAAQLNDMAKFFATPTGSVFARDYWLNSMTIDTIQTSLMVWPKMMKAVPDFAERLKKADALLPPAPKGSLFGPSEEDYLPTCAQDGDESDCTDADWAAYDTTIAANDAVEAAAAATAAAAAAGTSLIEGDTGDEPWYLEENWSASDRKKFEKASSTYSTHVRDSDTLYSNMLDAEEAAIEAAREKYKKQGWKPAPAKE